ncbi:MAG: hypothetical protein KAV87_58165, partial [Desulfobacteraceae bacterium]|nr:hypothetical protein [Desulfobacteraceae bacterium]
IGRKIRFLKRVEFVQGAGLSLPRSEQFHVDGKDGSDTHNGLSMDRAFKTIAAAITAMNGRIDWSESPWARSDLLYIAPGKYAEALTSFPYGCSVIGLGDAFDLNGERGVTIKPAEGSPVDCTSIINSRLENLCFESPDASPIFQVDNFNRNVLADILLSGLPGAITTTEGLEVVKDMTGNRLTNIVVQLIHNGIYIVTDNAAQKQASGNILEQIIVRGCDEKGIYFDRNCVPAYTILKDSEIGDGSTTLALGLDDNSAAVKVSNTNFQATAMDPAHQGGGKYNNCYLNGVLMLNA